MQPVLSSSFFAAAQLALRRMPLGECFHDGCLLLDPLTWWVRTRLCLLALARPFLCPFLSPGPGEQPARQRSAGAQSEQAVELWMEHVNSMHTANQVG